MDVKLKVKAKVKIGGEREGKGGGKTKKQRKEVHMVERFRAKPRGCGVGCPADSTPVACGQWQAFSSEICCD